MVLTSLPVVPRPAATVVLLRDGAAGIEAYLLRRVTGMAFAGGMTVFPGGSVDPEDSRADPPWVGPDPATWARRLGTDETLAQALVCAAIRETFEESGVLLASPAAGRGVGARLADVAGADWEAERGALEGRRQSLSDLLTRRGLLLRTDLLAAWSHWITPEGEPRRYDTRFFIAALPARQQTRHVGGEADSVLWMRPGDAVAARLRGELPMLPPTATTLEELSAYDSVKAAVAGAADRLITPVLPRIVTEGGQSRIVLPNAEDYP